MKKQYSLLVILTLVVAGLFFACSKQSEGSGVAPTYKSQATSTGNNPYNPPATT